MRFLAVGKHTLFLPMHALYRRNLVALWLRYTCKFASGLRDTLRLWPHASWDDKPATARHLCQYMPMSTYPFSCLNIAWSIAPLTMSLTTWTNTNSWLLSSSVATCACTAVSSCAPLLWWPFLGLNCFPLPYCPLGLKTLTVRIFRGAWGTRMRNRPNQDLRRGKANLLLDPRLGWRSKSAGLNSYKHWSITNT